MTETGRATLVILLLGYAAAMLAGAGARPSSLGPVHEAAETMAPRCAVAVERAGWGIACLDQAEARCEGLRGGDRVAPDGTRSRMAPTRLALFAVPIDVNGSTLDELASLPGIGTGLASRLAAARPYAAVDDLLRVPGIGKRRLAALRSRLIVDEPRR